MATDDANFVGAGRGTRAHQLKNHQKTDDFRCFLARVDRRRGRLLSPRWADPTEILRGKPARVWLLMMEILLGYFEVRSSSG